MRQVILDTETTGLNPEEGHRIIEIGCVELVNRRLTDRRFHVYLNPDRHIDEGAIEVHGITNEFLVDKPRFKDVADDFVAFVRDAELIIHNAPFDVGFINHEFSLMSGVFGRIEDYSGIFDTLTYARKKHPGQRNSLDALCKRYEIDNSHRELHGALLDAEILADVYLMLTGGQASLLEDDASAPTSAVLNIKSVEVCERPRLRIIRCSDEELKRHQERLEAIDKASGGRCLWKH
ncbi:MAG: DNA polymerase III subunit epsilon [Gammaproteobacteria bacterium]